MIAVDVNYRINLKIRIDKLLLFCYYNIMHSLTSNVLEKLKSQNVHVVSVELSEDLALEDDTINLSKGFYLTVNPFESYLMFWRENEDSHEVICELSPEANFAKVIQLKIEEAK